MEIPVVKIHRYFLQPTSGIPLASMGKLPLNGNLPISPIGKLPLNGNLPISPIGKLPLNGNLPIGAKGIPYIGWRKYRCILTTGISISLYSFVPIITLQCIKKLLWGPQKLQWLRILPYSFGLAWISRKHNPWSMLVWITSDPSLHQGSEPLQLFTVLTPHGIDSLYILSFKVSQGP